jgi:hypothetical protein
MNALMTAATLASLTSLLVTMACSGDKEDEGTEDDDCEPAPACTVDTDCGVAKLCTSGQCVAETLNGESVPLKEAKLIIEHNATDEDTGFQAFVDSEGWKYLSVTGPDGAILAFEGRGKLRDLGLTELFFETVEPENAIVPIDMLLEALPAGEYTFEGATVDGAPTGAKTVLSHAIPAGPELTFPAEGATVPPTDLVVRWEPVEETITGASINVVRYQVIVEKDEPPHARSIGKGLSVYLPSSATSLTVPDEFLEPGTPYLWEVLAISESGNQTLSSSDFETEAAP